MKNEEVEKTSLVDWPLPEAYLTELGRLSAAWSLLESLLDTCLGKLAGFDDQKDPTPFIIITHSSLPQKLDMLSALCEHLLPSYPHLRDYKAVEAQLRAAQKARNRFVHNGMRFNKNAGRAEMAIGSARGTLKVSVEVVNLVDIKRAAMQVHVAQLRLWELTTQQGLTPFWERRANSPDVPKQGDA